MSRDTTPIDFDDFFDPFESSSFIQPPNPLQPKGNTLKTGFSVISLNRR